MRTARPSTLSTRSRRRCCCWRAATIRAVHASEAQQVADAVKKNGGKVQLKIYKDEGHGFARVENQIDAYQKVSDFLKVQCPARDAAARCMSDSYGCSY